MLYKFYRLLPHNKSSLSWCRFLHASVCKFNNSPGFSSLAGVRVRFAPSPTGDLHLGGLRTALYNYLFSRSQAGKFILRIEDTDQTRLVPGATERLIAALEWAGPKEGGEYGPYVQSQRLDLYREAIQTLLDNGTAYRCFCSEHRLELLRRETRARGEVPRYDNRCRHLNQSEISDKLGQRVPYVVRFKLESFSEAWTDLVYGPIVCDVSTLEGDPVLMKSDGYPTYRFANVVDDHHMKISHVLRGVEWQVSTTKHILLYKAFGWTPPQFSHLPLLQNKDGKKLSKRQSDITVQHYKREGYFPEAILNLLTSTGSGFTVKDTAGLTLPELCQQFDLSLMKTNSTRFDFDKLPEYNRLHLKRRIDKSVRSHNQVTKSGSHLAEVTKSGSGQVPVTVSGSNCGATNVVKQMISLLQHEFINNATEQSSSVWSEDYIPRVLLWASDRITMLKDLLQPQYRYIWIEPSLSACAEACNASLPPSVALQVLQSYLPLLENLPSEQYDRETIANNLSVLDNNNTEKSIKPGNSITPGDGNQFSETSRVKYSRRMQLLRIAATGSKISDSRIEGVQFLLSLLMYSKEGPSVAEVFSVLGRDKTLQRLGNTVEVLKTMSAEENINNEILRKNSDSEGRILR